MNVTSQPAFCEAARCRGGGHNEAIPGSDICAACERRALQTVRRIPEWWGDLNHARTPGRNYHTPITGTRHHQLPVNTGIMRAQHALQDFLDFWQRIIVEQAPTLELPEHAPQQRAAWIARNYRHVTRRETSSGLLAASFVDDADALPGLVVAAVDPKHRVRVFKTGVACGMAEWGEDGCLVTCPGTLGVPMGTGRPMVARCSLNAAHDRALPEAIRATTRRDTPCKQDA